MGKLKRIESFFEFSICEDSDLVCEENANKCIDMAINTSLSNSKDFKKLSTKEYKTITKYKDKTVCTFCYDNYIKNNIEKYYNENKLDYELVIHHDQHAETMEIYDHYTVIYIDEN